MRTKSGTTGRVGSGETVWVCGWLLERWFSCQGRGCRFIKLASVRSLVGRHGGGIFGWGEKSTRKDRFGRTGCEKGTTRAVQNGILI